jgi:hypothetical protein
VAWWTVTTLKSHCTAGASQQAYTSAHTITQGVQGMETSWRIKKKTIVPIHFNNLLR